jgi:hypothetical protein
MNASASSFGTIKNLSNSIGTSSSSQIAVSNSNVFVVWSESVSGNNEIFFAGSSDNGTNFSDPKKISNSSDSSTSPQIAASEDIVYIAWREASTSSTEQEIFFTKSIDNGINFMTPTNISNSSGLTSSVPQIAVLDNNIYVAWEEQHGNPPTLRDIFLAASSNGGDDFNAPTNVSNSSGLDSLSVQLIADDIDTVRVVWVEFNSTASFRNIFFSSSTDGGNSFVPSVNISNNTGNARSPQISSSKGNIFITWGDLTRKDIFFAVSTDGGSGFGTIKNISNNGTALGSNTEIRSNPDMFVTGDSIYIVWRDHRTGNADVFFSHSLDTGSTFSSPKNISNSSQSSLNPKIFLIENTICIVWQENELDDIFLSVSTDGGTIFDDPLNISGSGHVVNLASNVPELTSFDTNAYALWEDDTPSNRDVFFRTISNSGPASITVESNSTSPRWGLDSIQVSGLVSGSNTDSIVIDWDDGASNSTTVSGNSWGSITHIYDSGNTGTKEITVKLLDEFGEEKASDMVEIEVTKHDTSLTLDPIPSVINGEEITATGILMDVDALAQLEGKTLVFDGTGSSNLVSTVTLADGSYSSTGPSPGTVSDLLTVQTKFDGDSAYVASTSETVTFDTAAFDAIQLAIGPGPSSVDLPGFNASIVFDNVAEGGTIFVSECDTPPSSRYQGLDTCIKLSSAIRLEENSVADIIMSFDINDIPAGHNADEIDIFHEELTGIVDVTKSREISNGKLLLTGEASSFSKFIVGIALHDEAPIGTVRHHVLLGHNEISFDFIGEEKEISLDSTNYRIGSLAEISVTDLIQNKDELAVNTVSTKVNSTSDPGGIIIDLDETGSNTGIFTGIFLLTGDASSNVGRTIHVEEGDEIGAFYNGTNRVSRPLELIIDGILEAGVIEVGGYDAPEDFSPVGDGYRISLIDAQLGQNANITITMSYSNVPDIDDALIDALEMRVLQMEGGICLDEITAKDSDENILGIDTEQNTVTGNTTTLGQFILGFPALSAPEAGCESGGPGGAGGGVAHPGAAVVLDAIVPIARAHHGSGGAASSGSVLLMNSGSNVKSETTVGSDTVTLVFDFVEPGSGHTKLTLVDPSELADIFDVVSATQGEERRIVNVDQATFSMAGNIFDIDASAVKFEGMVRVVIPYDENVALSSGSESNIRILHYEEVQHRWEDATIAVNIQNNTVTGIMNSLSPVVAAVVNDGTFPPIYFVMNPLGRIITDDPSNVVDNAKGEQISILMTIKNVQRANQQYTLLVQILDEDRVVRYISSQVGSLSRGQSTDFSSEWVPEEQGNYTVQIFVWDSMENPSPLSTVVVKEKTILGI